MEEIYAEGHDLDKLKRWARAISREPSDGFPVHAIFLVSSEDLLAHQVFRKFRDSFKGMDAGFRHLTIFGQHGQSSTLIRLLQEFGLSADSYSVLVLQVNNCDDFVYTLPLPSGNTNQGSVPESERPWERVMLAIESMARDWDATDVLSSIPEVVGMRKKNESLPDLVNRLVNEL